MAVYIGLGSNVGNRLEKIHKAMDEIAAMPETVITGVSSIYETSPWGYVDQADFFNAVIRIETALDCRTLLDRLLEIEIKLGRQRGDRWGPRYIDLDILLYGEEVVEEEGLRVPHPHLTERLFVLIPLSELDSKLVLPDGRRIADFVRERLRSNEERVLKIE